MKANILTIGDEILIGQTIDTNSATIAKHLNGLGIEIGKVLSVADEETEIVEGLKFTSADADIILITGGLGPTKDDITKHALCIFFQDKLVFQRAYFARVKEAFERRGIPVTDAHRQQFHLPSTAELYVNMLGSAPGMLFKKDGKRYFSMPGVPYEMEHLLTDRLVPLLKNDHIQTSLVHRTVLTAGIGETRIAELIDDIICDLPDYISVAYLPSLASVKVRLTCKTTQNQGIKILEQFFDRIKDRLLTYTYGTGDTLLEKHIGDLLKNKGLTISTAESCTGGHIGHKITSISGSSEYFKGGVISYSNELKMNMLGVHKSTLLSDGAVSEATVKEMQRGAIMAMNTDISIAVSGIAGPGGGTKEKPVGTVWIACGNADQVRTRKILAGKNRLKNIEYSTVCALNMVRQFINEVY